jgi:asparagine synthase (glutamine-hydrolysing)
MPERVLAAIHDPRCALVPGMARGRLAAALGGQTRQMGALTVAWTGGEAPDGSALVDGDVAAPVGWAGSWTAALAGLRDLRGAFALIAWDEDSGRALIARDHLGARPLFCADVGATLYVASEIVPLLDALPRRPEPDRDEVASRLAGRAGSPGATLFAGVREVAPAHALLLEEHGWRPERYWRPRARAGLDSVDRATAAAALRGGIEVAVRRHADVDPAATGVLASGGLDSSAVLACICARARGAGARIPSAFIGVPHRSELDETAFLDAVAERCQADVVGVPVPAGPIVPRALAYLERWAVPLEYPAGAFFSPVHEAAAARGATFLIDGEGGDELFGCEPFLIADRLRAGDLAGAARVIRALPGMVALDARSLRVVLRRWVAPALLPAAALHRLRRVRGARGPGSAWLAGAARQAAREPTAEYWRCRGEPHWRAHLAWVLTDSRSALGVHDHLRRVAALAGVRDAHPFLDVDLIELVLGLPPQFAFDARLDRALLREAMRGVLPERVRLREGKVYFGGLLRDALTGPDHAVVERTFTNAPLELGDLVDTDRLRAFLAGGPDRCPRGPGAWTAEIWRAFAFETWLRREAGRPREPARRE